MIFDASSTNPLVDQTSDIRHKSHYGQGYFAEGAKNTSWMGGTLLEASVTISEGVASGDWVGTGIGGAGLTMDMIGLTLDPLGTAGAQIAGWMLEHCWPYRAVLHALTGNADMIKGYAQTWDNIKEHMRRVGDDAKASADINTSGWKGVTADAYRRRAHDVADMCHAISNTAGSIATSTLMMGEVVAGIRTMVRDVLANLAGMLVAYTLELAVTGGVAAPVVAAQAVTKIASTGARIAAVVRKLIETISKLSVYLGALKNVLEALWKEIQVLRKRQEPAS